MAFRRRSSHGLIYAFVVVALLLGAAPVAAASAPRTRPAEPSAVAAPSPHTRAADLRVILSRLLGEHAFLSAEAMRAGVRGGAEFEAAAAALEGNTQDLADLIERVYGVDARQAFVDLWRDHLGFLVDYTVAVANGDSEGQEQARLSLEEFRLSFSRFLAEANPYLTETGVSELLGEHLGQLEQLASFFQSDYDAAYASARETYHHMFTMGDAIAIAIARQFPQDFPGRDVAQSPALDLRIALDRLLGEHTFLATEAMRAGIAELPEFDAARGSLEANSSDLSAAVGDVYGESAGAAFHERWGEHIISYLKYIDAIASGDDGERARQRAALEAYPPGLASLIASVNPHLPADQVEELVRDHAIHLISQVDAYADGDYERAYAIAREAYGHVLTMSDVLATAIAIQFPEVFPTLPATDARDSEYGVGRGSSFVLVAVLLAVVSWLGLRRGRDLMRAGSPLDRGRSQLVSAASRWCGRGPWSGGK